MKTFLTKWTGYIVFIFLGFILPIFGVERIDLVKRCDHSGICTPNEWKVLDSFDPKYLEKADFPAEAQIVNRFPITMSSLYPHSESRDFTLITEFDVPKEYLLENTISGIHLEGIGDAYSIYINGKLVGKEGLVENRKTVYSRYGNRLNYPLNFSHFRAGKNRLLIHIQGNPKFNLVGLFRVDGYYLGDYNSMLLESRDRIGIVLIFLYFFVGIYHLFLYSKRRNEKYNFAFSILAFSTFMYLINRNGIFFEYGLDSTIGYRIEICTVYFILPSLGCFLEFLFWGKVSNETKSYSFFSFFLMMITPFFAQENLVKILRVWQISGLIYVLYLFFLFYKAVKSKSESAKRLLFGFIIIVFSGLFDVLDSMFFKTGLIFTRFTFFGFIVGIAGLLANRFLNLHKMVEELNKSLEDKVEKRTQELQETLKEVKLLKESQDGDYFLTTLIINPLASNTVGDDTLDIKFLIHQKKKFEFRSKIYEIGGDICISEIIYLSNKKYTAFVNGDAMGKSIQGAGGALVLGVVFKSILSRASQYSRTNYLSPERWLKLAFQELQSIFESFEGSMMISVVMGLIDNERGFLYFINADHPFTVLYRDRRASFIEKGLYLQKIGMTTLEHSGDFLVNTLKLENNDVIFVGSDGRHDITLGIDEEGNRIINEDQSLFLEIVQQANADLEKIFQLTESKGELIDDYSLIRIEFKITKKDLQQYQSEIDSLTNFYKSGNISKAEEIIESLYHSECFHRTVLSLRAKIAYDKGMYLKAAQYYAEFLDHFPEENSLLLLTASCFRSAGDRERAADYSERLKLREPKNLANLVFLIEVYSELNNKERARKIWETLCKLDEKNPVVKLLAKKMDYGEDKTDTSAYTI